MSGEACVYEPIEPRSTSRQVPARFAIFGWGLLAVVLSVSWSWLHLDQGFFPSDEGQMGQAAERVLAGELPHRDFDDMYTGALSYLNALSFYWWGVDCYSMRLMLLLWFVPFVVAIYWLAQQLIQPPSATLVTLLAAAWSIPTYSGAAPSWHNLFFAMWALCAAVKFLQTDKRRYLVITGLMIGLSILFKITGVFILAGSLLFLLYRNQLQFENRGRSPFWLAIPILAAIFLAGMLSLCFVKNDIAAQIMHFAIPFLALTSFVFLQEWRMFRGGDTAQSSSHVKQVGLPVRWNDSVERIKSMSADSLSLLLGVVAPIVAFIAFYWQQNAIEYLIEGVLVLPGRRLSSACAPFPPVCEFVYTIPYFVLLFPQLCGRRLATKQELPWLSIAMIGSVVFLLAMRTTLGCAAVFFGFRNFLPVLVIGNLFVLRRQTLACHEKQTLFLITAVTFFASLIQYPFALPVYFFYFAPLLVLAALVSIRSQDCMRKRALTSLVVFLILFSCVRYHSAIPMNSKNPGFQSPPVARMETNRCRLRTDARIAGAYKQLHAVIETETELGETIFATPDSPESSFFSGRRPLNGIMYEFFRPHYYEDHSKVRSQLASANVNLVIVNEFSYFSAKVTDAFRQEALADFKLLRTISIDDPTSRQNSTESDAPAPMFSVYKRN